MKVMLSKNRFLLLITIGLIFFLIFDLIIITIMPSFYDIGKDLFINALFAAFTIFVIEFLIGYREDLIWKKVKSRIHKRISKQLFGLFLDLSVFCNRKSGIEHSVAETEEELEKEIDKMFIKQLEQLAERVELTDSACKFLVKPDTECLQYLSLIESREQSLSNVELKYSKFLSSGLVESIMGIKENLQRITLNMHKKASKNTPFQLTDEQYFEKLEEALHSIFKEISKVAKNQELGINFPPQ